MIIGSPKPEAIAHFGFDCSQVADVGVHLPSGFPAGQLYHEYGGTHPPGQEPQESLPTGYRGDLPLGMEVYAPPPALDGTNFRYSDGPHDVIPERMGGLAIFGCTEQGFRKSGLSLG